MTANIRTVLGQISKQKISGKPFKYRGLWFFVHKSDFGEYLITEWSTGAGFTYTRIDKIKTAIDSRFDKLGPDYIHNQIKKHIEKHGIANEPIPEGGEV